MLIPAQSTEIERIYHDIYSSGSRSVAITSSENTEGVSAIAHSLVNRLLLSGHSALLVDLNTYRPSLCKQVEIKSLAMGNNLLPAPKLVSMEEEESSMVVGVTAPNNRASVIKLRTPGVIESCIAQWLDAFEFVIFDTCPVNRVNRQNIPAVRVCAACDTCYLVVKSGVTHQDRIQQAVTSLNNAEVNLRGAILNDQNYPSLQQEMLRECKRVKWLCAPLARCLEKYVQRSQLLGIEH